MLPCTGLIAENSGAGGQRACVSQLAMGPMCPPPDTPSAHTQPRVRHTLDTESGNRVPFTLGLCGHPDRPVHTG